MGGYELIAVVVFFLVGYWAVDFFWPKKKADAAPAARPAPMQGDVVPNESSPWHEVLGVSPAATLEQIRAAYEQKSAEYHPSRVAGMGPAYEETATRMTRRINDAFEQAVRVRS